MTIALSRTFLPKVIMGLLALTVLSGCQYEVNGVRLDKEKGVYQGPKDTPLDGDKIRALQMRTRMQSNSIN